MRRSHTIRRVIAAVVVVALLMTILRLSRSNDDLDSVASAVRGEKDAVVEPQNPLDGEVPDFNAKEAVSKMIAGEFSSPVVIFSKTYCPFSNEAKELLLHEYTISPPPRVIDLDVIGYGKEIQEELARLTGRRTVPNIFVNGVSRGGATEMLNLGENIKEKFLEWGNGRFTMVTADEYLEQMIEERDK